MSRYLLKQLTGVLISQIEELFKRLDGLDKVLVSSHCKHWYTVGILLENVVFQMDFPACLANTQ